MVPANWISYGGTILTTNTLLRCPSVRCRCPPTWQFLATGLRGREEDWRDILSTQQEWRYDRVCSPRRRLREGNVSHKPPNFWRATRAVKSPQDLQHFHFTLLDSTGPANLTKKHIGRIHCLCGGREFHPMSLSLVAVLLCVSCGTVSLWATDSRTRVWLFHRVVQVFR